MHWRGSATWKWHGWMKITRSGGRTGRRRYPLRTLRCLSLRLDNRPTVEKSSRPIRNHQFSLGARPYAPWYRFDLKTGKKPTIAWTDSTIYRLLPTECQLDLGISAFDQIFLPRTLCFVSIKRLFSSSKFLRQIKFSICDSLWMRWIRVSCSRKRKKWGR